MAHAILLVYCLFQAIVGVPPHEISCLTAHYTMGDSVPEAEFYGIELPAVVHNQERVVSMLGGMETILEVSLIIFCVLVSYSSNLYLIVFLEFHFFALQ